MKLMYIIVRSDNEQDVVDALIDNKFQITKLATSGGFLKKGNTTLMCCCQDEQVNTAVHILKEECGKRNSITVDIPLAGGANAINYASVPTKIEVGGATVIVTDVCKFEKF